MGARASFALNAHKNDDHITGPRKPVFLSHWGSAATRDAGRGARGAPMMGLPHVPTEVRGAGGGMVRSVTLPLASYVNAQEAAWVGEKTRSDDPATGGK